MSADAKAWQDDDGWVWHGVNDLCDQQHTEVGLLDLLRALETCENKGQPMRWTIHVYPDGQTGLRGFCC
jgi:hypothetical protein